MNAAAICTTERHEQLKRDAWEQLLRIGSMPTYNDEPGAAKTLELRNCGACHSTLAKEIP